MNISMPRGDLRQIKFSINDSSGIVKTDFDEIYITFKKSYIHDEALFQKKLTTGDIEKDEQGYYHFAINPEDTNNLNYGKYVFDIEVYLESLIKQTTVGTLELTNEVTFVGNEGD